MVFAQRNTQNNKKNGKNLLFLHIYICSKLILSFQFYICMPSNVYIFLHVHGFLRQHTIIFYILSLIAYPFRENREFVFIIIVQFMMSANSRIRFALQIVLVCLYSIPSHYHHCAKLSEDIELKNACQIYFVECVSNIKHILPVIHYTTHYKVCGAVWFQLTHPLVMIEIIYILCLIIIIKSEVWTITHCLGLGHETMVRAVCLSIFVWNVLLWVT